MQECLFDFNRICLPFFQRKLGKRSRLSARDEFYKHHNSFLVESLGTRRAATSLALFSGFHDLASSMARFSTASQINIYYYSL